MMLFPSFSPLFPLSTALDYPKSKRVKGQAFRWILTVSWDNQELEIKSIIPSMA
jgi:hypothetical protein